MKKLVLIIFVLLIALSCKHSHQENILKQQKQDLLADVTTAICYSGFRDRQHPDRGNGAVNPSYEEIVEDLKILSHNGHFKLIRVYDSGENTQMVLKAIHDHNIDIKVMLGIWLSAEISTHETCAWLTEPIPDTVLKQNKLINQEEIQRGIALANLYPDIVIAVNVGNEALVDWNDHKVDTDTIISYVKKVKQNIAQPVTVAENYKWWADHGRKLANAVDFVSVHTYPVWEGRSISEGMPYTIENLIEVRTALPDKQIVITEAGWPSQAIEFGDRASEEIQARYYNEILTWAEKMSITTFIFEAFDESWKGDPDNPLGAEKHWGIFTEDRKPKEVMRTHYSHLN